MTLTHCPGWYGQTGHNPSHLEDLECLPTLDLWVQEFLAGEEMPWASNEHKGDSNQPKMPEPSLEDSINWILWCMPSGWKHHPGDQSCKRSQTRLISPNLQEGYGHHFRCQRWGAVPQRWRMTIQHCPSLTVSKGMHSCPSTTCNLLQPGLLYKTATENPGICQGIAALGGEGLTTNARQATASLCRVHIRTEGSYGAFDYIYGCRRFWQWCAFKLGKNNIHQDIRSHRTYQLSEVKSWPEL